MASKGKWKCVTVYLAAAVILTCYLAQMIDCYRLRKTGRREGRKEVDAAKTVAVQEGQIVFGRVFEKGSGLSSQVIDGTKKSSSNASVEDEAAYQADSAGWLPGQDAGSRAAAWKRMVCSLQCGADQLKFRAVGPGASQFAVEQGNAPPLPLSQVPSTCGYSMQTNSLALVMLVPYDGCNVVQEGGSYVLPMHWQGVTVSLWCPAPAVLYYTSNVSDPQLPPSYFFPPYNYPQDPLVGLPDLTNPTTTTMEPEMPTFPQYPPFFPPFHLYFPPPLPATTAASTTTQSTTTTKKPQVPTFPQYPPFFPPFYPFPLPAITAAPTTTAAPPQTFPLPVYPPYLPFPWLYPRPPTTTPTTTQNTPTMTTPSPQRFPPQFPPWWQRFPPQFPPWWQQFLPQQFPPYPQDPASAPQMTTTQSTTTKANPPLTPSPFGYWPYFQ